MLGLIYLVAGVIYCALTIVLVFFAIKRAKSKNKAPWKYWVPVIVVMYLIVFWDWIPTLVVHQYNCSKYSGFYVSSAFQDLVNKKQDITKLLEENDGLNLVNAKIIREYPLNKKFTWIRLRKKAVFGVKEINHQIVNNESKNVIAKYIDYTTDIQGVSLGPRNIRDLKFWMSRRSCELDRRYEYRKAFYKFKLNVKNNRE